MSWQQAPAQPTLRSRVRLRSTSSHAPSAGTPTSARTSTPARAAAASDWSSCLSRKPLVGRFVCTATLLCSGEITSLVEICGEGPLATARAADGSIVSRALVSEAAVGSYVLCKSGLAIELLEPDRALEAVALRRELQLDRTRSRRSGGGRIDGQR